MKTGIIGLGAMGTPMALNLHRAGFLEAVWNRTRVRGEQVGHRIGTFVAESPSELASRCELIVTCVSRDSDVGAVVDALIPGLKKGAVVVDTSTVSAETARKVAAAIAARDGNFLDAPVSGGVEGAKQGTLAMMVGGDAEVLERVQVPLYTIARRIVHLGPVGSGQATKAVNQIMAAGINQAVTEALAFGQAMGLPMDKVIDVVSSGAAANWFLTHRGQSMLSGHFAPGFQVELHEKDLHICREMAKRLGGGTMPMVEMTSGDYRRLMEEGYGDEDISALFRLKIRQYPRSGVD
jgi:3-hydroxyisobutyrate dehydrogenase